MQKQLSAYDQLEQLYQRNDIVISDYQSALSNQILLFSTSKMDQDKTFIQIQTDQISTQIATVNVPNAKQIHLKDLQSQEFTQIFSQNQEIILYQFMHSSQTISISYLEFLESFAITYNGFTIIVENEQDIHKQQYPKYRERFISNVSTFFGILQKLSMASFCNFKKDLSNRSLIGICCYKSIQWLGIVEHYGSEKLLPPNVVKNFLQKYNLEFVFVKCYKNLSHNSLQQIYQEIRNQLLFDFNEMNRGSTIYLWSQEQFLGCYFIGHKHYEILETVKRMLIDKRNIQGPFTFLGEYDLSRDETQFYKKYIQRILQENQQDQTFSNLTSIIFNNILHDQFKFNFKFENRYPLSFCMKPTLIVIIPIGFNLTGLGFDRLFQSLQQTFFFVKKIKSPDQITNHYQIYCFDKCFCLDQSLKLIDYLKKKKNIKTIGLLQENNQQNYKLKNGIFFPFSFDYISYSLIESSKNYDDFQDTIKILLSYQDQDMKQLPLDELLYISIMPEDQNQRKNNFLCSEQDVIEIIFNKNLNMDQTHNHFLSLRKNSSFFKDQNLQVLQQLFQRQSFKLIADIEAQMKIFLLNPKTSKSYVIITTEQYKPELIKNRSNQYIISNDSWKEIEDYVLDSLELVSQKYKQNESLSQTLEILTKQFLECGQVVYKNNLNPLSILNKHQKMFYVKMQIVVIVLNGIIIILPQDLKLFQGITIYTKKLEASNMLDILNILKVNIEILQQENKSERFILDQQFQFNNQDWNAYIVKFQSPEINFENLQQE
ncbi:unnamed protein product [Paramecium sonneborni]|uniref:Uncharacterized protein n=1 Tax=Paramecium sonneborni TaxID=65129 RepID=A0A8S1M2J4_9CILI|nr:unnamed protein product [Paramecium sonneborni]